MRWTWVLALAGLLLIGCAAGVPEQTEPLPEEDANAAIAANVPWTDIWLLSLDDVLAGNERARAKNITNRRGYDNQPAFTADGKRIVFSSIRDGRQSDVFEYDIDTGATRQLTRTPQSEYSPTPRPEGMSLIQVALDGTQRLWLYKAGGEPVRPVRGDVTGVGYHAWLDDETVAMFLVEEPLRLVTAKLGSEDVRDVAIDIGRSLHALPGGRLAYVYKGVEGPWSVREFNPASGEDRALATTPTEAEDMAWLADGSALMASGRQVLRLAPGAATFEPLVTLAYGLHGDIGRLAVDPQGRWLAVVVNQVDN